MTRESPDVSAQLRLPTYQNRLRVIGRQLDRTGYRSVNLMEIGAGFLVRVLRSGERVPQALEFPHTDFPDMFTAAIRARGEGQRRSMNHPLLPTGYEDFLRALGYRLDQQLAEAIAITELDDLLVVNGVATLETYHQTSMAPFQILLRADEIASIIDEAFRRRAPTSRVSSITRALGR